jgi:phage tail-like protein
MKLIETPTAAQASVSANHSRDRQSVDSTPLHLTPTFLFYVKLGNFEVAMFTECSGIGAKRGFDPVREGGVNDHAHILPGPMEYSNITLKRGLSLSTALWDWFQAGKFDYAVQRQDVTIYQYSAELIAASAGPAGSDRRAGAVKTWSLANAFPVSWKLSDLNSGTSSLSIESLEIAHEGLSLIKE